MARRPYYTARSRIHGTGLFARRRFARGELIGTFEGVAVHRDGTHVLWIEDEEGESVGIEGRNELRFLNHSARPNAEFDRERLYALETIRPRDEITAHYGDDWDDVG